MTPIGKKLTQADMVLVALFEAASGSLARVPYEEIVLTAWAKFPQSFSLRNHPEHPDSSDIHKRLYQTLIPSGCAASLGHKVFRLTEKGQVRAGKLLGIGRGPTESRRLSRAQELFYRHAKSTRAYQSWIAGGKSGLVDYDARLFFQFGPTTSIEERKRRVGTAIETLQHAEKLKLKDSSELLLLARHLSKLFATLFREEA